jgi:hypothetical protein
VGFAPAAVIRDLQGFAMKYMEYINLMSSSQVETMLRPCNKVIWQKAGHMRS